MSFQAEIDKSFRRLNNTSCPPRAEMVETYRVLTKQGQANCEQFYVKGQHWKPEEVRGHMEHLKGVNLNLKYQGLLGGNDQERRERTDDRRALSAMEVQGYKDGSPHATVCQALSAMEIQMHKEGNPQANVCQGPSEMEVDKHDEEDLQANVGRDPLEMEVEKDKEQVKPIFPRLSDEEFRTIFRTTREGFAFLVEKIEKHPIFSNPSLCSQFHPSRQLAVALARLGTRDKGDGRLAKALKLAKVSVGTVSLYTKRVLIALGDLRSEWLSWPDEDERDELGQEMRTEGFPGCVGFLGRTNIPLTQRPGVDKSGMTYCPLKEM
ncbi:MAG: hypothetical protein J3Q66DRAFT_133546 [Benniella sp.]|nr:MAG: hypothetical protein J3Q66DRAFT_133546 [Benniella sp.]